MPGGVASCAGCFFGGAGCAGTNLEGDDEETATGESARSGATDAVETDAVEPDAPPAIGPLADTAVSESDEEGCFSWSGTAETGV